MSHIPGLIVLGGSAAFIGYTAPQRAGKNTLLFCPATHFIHKLAHSCTSSTEARWVQVLHYIGKPIDRTIQAIAAPLFALLQHFMDIKEHHHKGETVKMTLRIIATPIVLPLLALRGLLDSTFLLLNGALQLVIPYQMIATILNVEAALQYFDLRKHLATSETLNLLPSPLPLHEPSEPLAHFAGKVKDNSVWFIKKFEPLDEYHARERVLKYL